MWDNRANDAAWSKLRQMLPPLTQLSRTQQQSANAAMLHITKAAIDASQAAKAAAHGEAAKNGAKAVTNELATAVAAAAANTNQVASGAASKAASADWWKLAAADLGQRWADTQMQAHTLGEQVSAKAKEVARKGIRLPGKTRQPANSRAACLPHTYSGHKHIA